MNYEVNCKILMHPNGTVMYKAWFDEIRGVIGVGSTIESAVDALYKNAKELLEGEDDGN